MVYLRCGKLEGVSKQSPRNRPAAGVPNPIIRDKKKLGG